ncbi:MAG: hypothetical protein RRY64_08800 [Oscillospiraceae bacterium]
MTAMDREIALALLGRLRERELITETAYTAACNARFFDSKNFVGYAELTENTLVGKEGQQNERSENP